MTIVGKDSQGKYWCKTDSRLTDVTDCYDFQVVESGIWTKKWTLYGLRIEVKGYYSSYGGTIPDKIEWKQLGVYKSERDASMALEQVMAVKEITEIDPLTKQPSSSTT